ncbi:MAG: 30S ribosomal protein S6e [Nanohaloarchaea archaeon]|nr:30S ribosomal protein S6e [Candidatus Nanohaloarchaea archaeon]
MIKFVINEPKTGKSFQKEMEDKTVAGLIGKKIGDEIDAGIIGLPGYKITITGGSDKNGFGMRKDVDGTARKKILIAKGPGYKYNKGIRRRKSIRGNTVSTETAQINAKITKVGPKKLEELLGASTEEKKE